MRSQLLLILNVEHAPDVNLCAEWEAVDPALEALFVGAVIRDDSRVYATITGLDEYVHVTEDGGSK